MKLKCCIRSNININSDYLHKTSTVMLAAQWCFQLNAHALSVFFRSDRCVECISFLIEHLKRSLESAWLTSITVSQFRVCILRRTRPLWSSKAVSTVVKWDGLAFGVFPYIMIFGLWKWRSTPRDVSIFSLSFFFFGHAKNLGICEATYVKDSSRASSKKREKKAAFGRAFRLRQLLRGVVT